jgi:tRNA nucleotidyltransferase (CCA-adding enzyme)
MNTILDRLKGIFPVDAHQRVYLVGGAVRDLLMGLPNTDIDLAAALTTEEFSELGFRLVEGRSTAAIWHRHIEGLGTLEVTPLAETGVLADDLRRRDFTVNAMAVTLGGEVIDPLNARLALHQKRLSACSRHVFIDDPMRVFRAFRFVADGWCLSQECETLLREHDWTRELFSIPVERFSREMLKALDKPEPWRFFQLMLEYGVGQDYLPELFRMPLIPAGPLIHHPEGDLFTHSCQVLQRVTDVCRDPVTRFCALFHDIGKLGTSPDLYPKHHGHDQAGFGMAREFCGRLRLPAHYGTSLSWISRLHGTFNLWEQLRDSTKLWVANQAIKAGIVDILPLVAAADKAGGSEPAEWREALHCAGMSSSELGIEPQVLECMQPFKRTDHILLKRVERFRTILTASI